MHVSELRHPDDAAHSMAGRRGLAEGVSTVRMENRFRHKDGSWRWLAWTLTAENGLIYLIGRHVTAEKLAAQALRESERQFRLFTEAATDHALIRLDAQGVVSGWNAGAQRIEGYAETEIVGQHFSRFYTAADRAAGAPENALAMAAASGARGSARRKSHTPTACLFAAPGSEPDRHKPAPAPCSVPRSARE
jgi:PAS domain-containing protein